MRNKENDLELEVAAPIRLSLGVEPSHGSKLNFKGQRALHWESGTVATGKCSITSAAAPGRCRCRPRWGALTANVSQPGRSQDNLEASCRSAEPVLS